MTSNLLVCEEVDTLPFPEEVKDLINLTNWKDSIWQTFGLPIPFAKYSLVSGKSLYLEELPDGTTKIEKQDFTGEVVASCFLQDLREEGQYHYIISFDLTFLKGEIIERALNSIEKILKSEYEQNLKQTEAKYNKNIKLRTHWAFRYLYRPYKRILQGLFFIPIGLFTLGRWVSIWILRKLTPW